MPTSELPAQESLEAEHVIPIKVGALRLKKGRTTLWRWWTANPPKMPPPKEYGPNSKGWPSIVFEEFLRDPEGWRSRQGAPI